MHGLLASPSRRPPLGAGPRLPPRYTTPQRALTPRGGSISYPVSLIRVTPPHVRLRVDSVALSPRTEKRFPADSDPGRQEAFSPGPEWQTRRSGPVGAVPCIWFRRLGRATDGLQASPGRARAKELAALEEKRRINSRTKKKKGAPSACTVSVAAASTLRKVDASDPHPLAAALCHGHAPRGTRGELAPAYATARAPKLDPRLPADRERQQRERAERAERRRLPPPPAMAPSAADDDSPTPPPEAGGGAGPSPAAPTLALATRQSPGW